jgi:uncharacterized Zn-binding protein involved in type VI secretion
MKKILLAVTAALSLSAFSATWERAGAVQVTDTTGLTVAVAKLGEMTGNQMLGAMAASYMSQLPTSEFFGPTRQGGSIVFPFYVDAEAFAKAGAGDEEAFDDLDDGAVEIAIIYPMALPKEEFMKLHEGAIETNGFVRVNGLPFGDSDEEFTYVAFAEDGKWAVASDKPEQVTIAMNDLADLVKPMDGDVARVSVTAKGTDALRKVIDVAAKKIAEDSETKLDAQTIEYIKGFSTAELALRVADAGIDTHGSFTAVPGSLLATMGQFPIAGEPLAKAGEGDIIACHSTFAKFDVSGRWNVIDGVLKKHKIDTSSFLKWEFGDFSRLTVDLPAAFAWAKAAETNGLDEVDSDEVLEDIKSALENANLKCEPADKEYGFGLAIAGYKLQYTPAQRFAKVLPEVKGKPLVGAATYTIAGLIQAILPPVMAMLDAETRASIAPMAALLPKECAGGLASAYWREGENGFGFLGRISADEIKGIGVSVGTIAAASMMGQGAASDDDDDDDDDDDGDDDSSDED